MKFLQDHIFIMQRIIDNFQRDAGSHVYARTSRKFTFPRGLMAGAITSSRVWLPNFMRYVPPMQDRTTLPAFGTLGHSIYEAHQNVLRGNAVNMVFPPRVSYLSGLKKSNALDVKSEIKAKREQFNFEVGRTQVSVRSVPNTDLFLRFKRNFDIREQSRSFVNWVENRPESHPPKRLIGLAGRIYANLYHNYEHMNVTFTSFKLKWNIPHPHYHPLFTYSTIPFAREGPNSVFVRARMTSNVKSQKAEILYIAMRIAHNFIDFEEFYKLERIQWDINGVSIIQYIHRGYWDIDHVVRGGMYFPDPDFVKEPFVKYNLKKLISFLDKNDLVLTMPQTRKNCFSAAIYMAKHNILLNEAVTEIMEKKAFQKLKNRISSAANRIMNKIDLGEGLWSAKTLTHEIDKKNVFKSLSITVWTHDLNVVAVSLPEKMTDKTKNIDVVVFGGHAYGIIKKLYNTLSPKQEPVLIQPVPLYSLNKPIGYYDIETCADTVEPYCVGYLNPSERYYSWVGLNCLNAFLSHLFSNEQGQILYAHNGGKFDTILMEQALRKPENSQKFFLRGIFDHSGTILKSNFVKKIRIPAKRKRGTYLNNVFSLQDTYPHLRMSLRAAGETYKVDIVKGEIDHDVVNTTNFLTQILDQNILEYLKKDVYSLKQITEQYRFTTMDKLYIDPLTCLTRAGVTRKLFLSRYYDPEKYPLYLLPDEMEKFTKMGYYGGRAQNYYRGVFEGELEYPDFVSLYPKIMDECELPYGIPEWVDLHESSELPKDFEGFVLVDVKGGRANSFNPLRYHHNSRGLIDPVFSEWTRCVYSAPDIRLALDPRFKYEFRFIKGLKFKTGKFLQTVVRILFALKQSINKEEEPAQYNAVKEALNSLYGFFGLRLEATKLVRTTSETRLISYFLQGKLLEYNETFNIARVTDKVDADVRYTAIAAYVTAHAHRKLIEKMLKIEDHGYLTYYTDTDSIVTNAPENVWGPCINELGELTREVSWKIVKGVFVAPKLYALVGENAEEEQIVKCKGLPNDILKETDFEELLPLLNGEPLVFTKLRFRSGQTTWLGGFPELKKEEPEIKITGVINKGIMKDIGNDQYHILPLWMDKHGRIHTPVSFHF